MSITNSPLHHAHAHRLVSRGDDLGEEETETPSYLTDALPDVINDEIKAPAQQETVSAQLLACYPQHRTESILMHRRTPEKHRFAQHSVGLIAPDVPARPVNRVWSSLGVSE